MKKRTGACKRKREFLAVMLPLFVLLFGICARADEVQYQGLDDYLRNTGETDWFGYQVITYDQKVKAAQKARDELASYLDAAEKVGYGLSAEYRMPGDKKEKVEIMSEAFGSGFITVRLGQKVEAGVFRQYKLALLQLDHFIEQASDTHLQLRTVYRGFSVVGSMRGAGNGTDPNGNVTFQVGTLSEENVLDKWRKSVGDKLYQNGAAYESAIEEGSGPGRIEEYIAEPIGEGAFRLYLWMSNFNIDLSMDGLVFGRLSPLYHGTVDFTHFGMEENNPYGFIAATAYYVLRRMFLGIAPVIMMCLLFRELFHNGPKGRAVLKETMTNLFLAIALSFVAPYLILIFITVRDGVLKYASLGMGKILSAVGLGSGAGSSVIGLIYITYMRNHTLLNALVWAAAVFSGFAYLVTYVQIAMLLMGCVAIAPVCLFISVWNPKILRDWWNVFFPNLCVPLIDLVMLQLPSVMLLLFKREVGAGGGSIILGILIIIIMWNSLMIRDRVVRLLGFEGLHRNGGALLATAAVAARMARMGAGRMAAHGGTDRIAATRGDAPDGEAGARFLNAERGKLQGEALLSIAGPEAPAGNERSYDPNLGSATEDFLRDLDERSADPVREGPPEDKGMEKGGLEGGAQDGIETMEKDGREMPDAEGMETTETSGDLPPGTEEVPAEEGTLPGGHPLMEEGGGPDGMPEEFKALDPDGRVPAGDENDPGQSPPYPQSEAILTDVDGELKKAYGPEGTEDRGAFSDLANGDFHATLHEGAEKGRYENLARMDAYNAVIRENEEKMKRAGYARDSYERDRAAFLVQENRLSGHLNGARERLNAISDRTGEEYRKEWNAVRAIAEGKAKVHERVARLDEAAGLDRANARYREEVQRMAQTENSYAKAWSLGGMSERTFQSARDFERQLRLDGAKKKIADYRNFDSRQFEGILSPAEKEGFYREREMRLRHERMLRAVGTGARIAGAGAGAVTSAAAAGAGLFIGAYGGEASSASLGVLTGTGAGLAVRGAVSLGANAAGMAARAVTDHRDAPYQEERGNIRTDGGHSAAPSHNESPGVLSGHASGKERQQALSDERSRKGSGNASARTLSKNAEGAVRERGREGSHGRGSGNADPGALSQNASRAEREGGHENGRVHGSGNASAGTLSGNASATERAGEAAKTAKGSGNADPGTLSKNAGAAERRAPQNNDKRSSE